MATEQSGKEGRVSISAILTFLNTPAWKDLKKPKSKLCMWLKEHCLHADGTNLDYNKLIMVGLLHAQDKANCLTKAKWLYNILQEGGSEVHEFISAKDKDFVIVYEQMFKLVTTAAFDGAEQ